MSLARLVEPSLHFLLVTPSARAFSSESRLSDVSFGHPFTCIFTLMVPENRTYESCLQETASGFNGST